MQKKSFIAFIASFFIVAGSQAQSSSNTKTAEKNSFHLEVFADQQPAVFGLAIQNPEQKRLRLEVSHPVLGAVVDTIISSRQFTCRYNLNQADDGHYRIIVRNGKEKFIKEVEINTVTSRNLVIH